MNKQPHLVKKYSNIQIVSNKSSYIQKIIKALKFIKKIDPKNFKKVNDNLQKIIITNISGTFGAVYPKEQTFIITQDYVDKSHYKWLASCLIHEAHHIVQYKKGKRGYGYHFERGAYIVQKKFLKKANYELGIQWLEKEFKNKWWEDFKKQKAIRKKFRDIVKQNINTEKERDNF
jgi:hypothetical protein